MKTFNEWLQQREANYSISMTGNAGLDSIITSMKTALRYPDPSSLIHEKENAFASVIHANINKDPEKARQAVELFYALFKKPYIKVLKLGTKKQSDFAPIVKRKSNPVDPNRFEKFRKP